jgi:uncharacterized protein YbcI
MKTQGEAEGQISSKISSLYLEIFGKGPVGIRVNSVDNIVVVISNNLLTNADKLLIKTDVGCEIAKEIRNSLIHSSKKELKKIISDATGEEINTVHHDFSVTDGEEAFVFSLTKTPAYRSKKTSAIH